MSENQENVPGIRTGFSGLSFLGVVKSGFQCFLKIKSLDAKRMQRLILLCFFISGACGLVYEVAWLRVLGLIFGNTTFATSTVLAGYMAGLGLGAFWWGKRIDQGGNPVKVYARLEAGIGIYALLTPFLWKLIDLLTIGFYRFISPNFFTALIFKFIIAFSALLIPTFLMGATLPVLSKFFVKNDGEVAKQVGLLYGLNTLGAVLGVLFSGFIALQTFGVWQTVYLTAILNLVIFFLCVNCYPAIQSNILAQEKVVSELMTSPADAFSTTVTRILLILFAVSGAISMMYEIAWTRVLAMSLGSSVYAFCVMLATFLFGISIGSYLFSRIPRTFLVDLHTFAAFQALTAITAFLGINFFNDMPYYFVQIFFASKGSEFALHLGRFFLCSVVMLPPTLCIGAMFSCFIHVLRRSQPLGKEIGTAYFSNTIGTILGSVVTGFCIIPIYGIQNTLLIAGGLNIAIALLVFFLPGKIFHWKRYVVFGLSLLTIALCVSTVRPWNRGLISSDLAVKPEHAKGMSKGQLLKGMQERDLLFYKEGLSATVTVTRFRDNLALAVNGKVDASSQDTFTQFLLGHLPMALHPDPRKTLIIGLGSGSTAAAVASYPVEKIDVVELEKAVVEAAGYFHELNRNVLKDPRLRMHINDGRNFVLMNPEKYDVIISEPSNPWMAGVANLFSIEHYRTMQKRLAPGGIVCQWLHAYSMSQDDLRMVIRTFAEVFPDVSLWVSYFPDLMMIGKNEQLRPDMKTLQKAFKIPEVLKDLGPHGIQTPEDFLANAMLFDPALRLLAQNAKINSDNHPFLEFSAPRDLYKNTIQDNFMLLSVCRKLDTLPDIQNLKPPRDQNVKFYNALVRGALAKKFMSYVEPLLEKAKAIDPHNIETAILTGMFYYQTNLKQKSREIFSKVIEKDPSCAIAYYYTGLALEDEGQVLQAISFFHKAVDLDTKNPDYLISLGDAFLTIDQGDEALKCFNKALIIQPNDFDTWNKRTLLISKQGTFEEKKQAFMDTIREYPRYIAGYQWLGNLFEQNGTYSEALKVYGDMTTLFPDDSFVYINLARLSDGIGRKKDVKKYITMAIRCDPSLVKDPNVQKILHQ